MSDQSEPTLKQLNIWKRRLDRAHGAVMLVANKANRIFGEDNETAILLNDPLIELHVALGVVEQMIAERTEPSHEPV